MRNDVVNDSCGSQLALGQAHDAQRMRRKKCFADFPPASIVDVVLYPSVVLPLSVSMCFTVTLPSVCKVRTAGNSARMVRFIRHKNHPFISALRNLSNKPTTDE